MACAARLDRPEPCVGERGRQVGGRECVQKGAVAGRVAERLGRPRVRSPDSTAATASASSAEAPVARAEATGGVIACLGGDRQGLAKGRRAGEGEDGGDLPFSRVRAFRRRPSPATSRSDFGDARALPGDRRTFVGDACTSTTSTLMSIQFESSDETSSASSR